MREAVAVIADMRDSDRLRKFLETGSDRTFGLLQKEHHLHRASSWRDNPCYASRLAKRSQPAREYVLFEFASTGLPPSFSHIRRLLRLVHPSTSILSKTSETPLRLS